MVFGRAVEPSHVGQLTLSAIASQRIRMVVLSCFITTIATRQVVVQPPLKVKHSLSGGRSYGFGESVVEVLFSMSIV